MAQSNVKKWWQFVAGRLYAETGGQNINDNLQKNLANELDGILTDLVGPAVLGGVSGLAVTAGAGLAVNVAAGSAAIEGQRVKATGSGSVSGLPASTSGIKIYVAAGTPFSVALAAWPVSLGFTTGALGASQLLLATVNTDGTSVILVTDGRVIAETLGAIAGTTDDTVTPAASAGYLRLRLNMFAARLKSIVGGAGWLDAVPASLTTLWGKFNATTGHVHSGAANDAPKIAASNVTFPPAGGLSATDVEGALDELDAEKFPAAGGTISGGLVVAGALTQQGAAVFQSTVLLAADPTLALQAATKQYIDDKPAAGWVTAPGTPVIVQGSQSQFTVTGDQSAHYYPGRVLRYKDTAGGSTYQYTLVKSYASGTITVLDDGLDSGLNGVQLAAFEPVRMIFPVAGRMPSFAENNLSGRFVAPGTMEPVGARFYVEVTAATNGATSGNTGVRLRRGTSPTSDGGTDVMAASNLAHTGSDTGLFNPVHTEITTADFLQLDITAAPTGGQADDLFLVLYGVPKWAKNL